METETKKEKFKINTRQFFMLMAFLLGGWLIGGIFIGIFFWGIVYLILIHKWKKKQNVLEVKDEK